MATRQEDAAAAREALSAVSAFVDMFEAEDYAPGIEARLACAFLVLSDLFGTLEGEKVREAFKVVARNFVTRSAAAHTPKVSK